MVLGTHVVLRMAELDLLKIFCPQNGENRPSLGFFECMGKFSFFSQFFNFFSTLSLMKAWTFRLWDFSTSQKTLKLAVSHEEINEINSFLLCPSSSFLRDGSLGITDFCHNGR